MKFRNGLLGLAVVFLLSGCAAFSSMLCHPHCRASASSSSSLVSFLYPSGTEPPRENSVPQLNLPLRVGIAFIPQGSGVAPAGLEAARREEIVERIRKHFADRKFVSEIVMIPDYYLRGRSGFEGLEGVQRLYGADVMALVSYDQVTYRDENNWSLGYLTIVGAYVLKGSQHDVITLMDLAVIDPASRSILLRAGGTDDRRHRTTAANEIREVRASQGEGFSVATDDLIANFDDALTKFEADVREGKANVRVTQRSEASGHRGGGGAFDWATVGVLAGVLALMRWRRARPRTASAAACARSGGTARAWSRRAGETRS
jgi:rhombotail lipoprotein